MKEIFRKISEILREKFPKMQIEVFANQFEKLNREHNNELPLSLPAVLVEFANTEWKTEKNRQVGDTIITIHIGQNLYSEYSSQTTDSFKVLDLVQAIYLAIQNEATTISTPFKRKTTRVPFSTEKVSNVVWELMGIEASRFENMQFSFLKSMPEELRNYILSCDPLMWKNQKIAKDFLKWVRLSEEESQRTTNGMPWQTLGMSKADLLPFYLLKKWPILIRILWPLALGKKIARNAAQLLPKETSIFGIAIKDNQPGSLVEAGRMAYRLWLLLTSENVAVQPLSLCSLTGFDILSGVAPHLSDPATVEKYKSGFKLLRKQFQFKPGWHPVWMFRVGKAAMAARLSRLRI